MSDWTLGESDVLSGTLAVRAVGAWAVDLEVDTDEDLTGPVTLTTGSLTWRGTVVRERSGVFELRWRGRVVAGAGRLDAVLPARMYRSVPARLVARDLAAEAGEVLAADAAGLDVVLPFWVRRRETLAAALSRLTEALGLAWRVTAAGELTTTPWATENDPAGLELISEDTFTRSARFASDEIAPMPGAVIDGRTVEAVTFTLDASATRAEVTYRAG